MDNKNILYHGDCLIEMDKIPDKSVDMIMCDLPYGTTQNKWDAIIPFDKLWEQYWRIVKPNAAIVLTAAQPFTSSLIMSDINHFAYCWIWRKSKVTGVLNAKLQPLRNYEDVCVFQRTTATYNPQGIINCNKRLIDKGRSQNYGDKSGKEYLQTQTDYPRQVIDFPSQVDTIHPTQKPVALMEYLIKTYTNEGETVLDNCMGSGTTGVACKNLSRNFIGIEQDEYYFKIAKERIDKAKARFDETREMLIEKLWE